MQFNNPRGKIKDNMTTRRLIESIGRSSSRLVPIIAKPIKGGMRIAKSNCAFATKPILLSIAAFFLLVVGLAGLTGVFMGGSEVRAEIRAQPQAMCTPCPGATPSGLASVLAREARVSAAPIPPPTCPGPECEKKITIFNNTNGTIWVAIQAGFQNPDPWLQALFANNQQSYAETHLSRVLPRRNPAPRIYKGDGSMVLGASR